MLQGKYIKLISHIVKDSEEAEETAKTVYSKLVEFGKSINADDSGNNAWKLFSHPSVSSFDEITAEYFEVTSDMPEEKTDMILSAINKLENGSYGLLLVDSYYGVVKYKCYGNAVFEELPVDEADEYFWFTDDYICIEKKISIEKLVDLLDCKADRIVFMLENNGKYCAAKIVPDPIFKIFPNEMFDCCAAKKMRKNVSVKYMLTAHDHPTRRIQSLQRAFRNKDFCEWTLRLSQASENKGVFENVMICPERNAVLIFETKLGAVKDIRCLKMYKGKPGLSE